MIKEKSTRGLTMRNGTYHIDKMVRGVRIYKNLKTTDLKVAKETLKIEVSKIGVGILREKEKWREVYASEEWRAHVKNMLESETSWIYARLKMLRRRGKENGKGCTLTPKELAQLLLECDGACTVTGIPFNNEVPEGAQRAPLSMSVDRKESSKGYHYENCRIVCLAVNLAMSNWGVDSWLRIAKAIAQKELEN